LKLFSGKLLRANFEVSGLVDGSIIINDSREFKTDKEIEKKDYYDADQIIYCKVILANEKEDSD